MRRPGNLAVLGVWILVALSWGWWGQDIFTQPLGQVQGNVSAEVSSNDGIEQLTRELQVQAPGVYEANVSLDKDINGVQVHASSSCQVISSY
ncbi:MAG: hypothetical protein VB084_09820 [Syntrophomonadaceae bacterium]|nr:hypothetical protein [Syntrophomonadaceae bacterium]